MKKLTVVFLVMVGGCSPELRPSLKIQPNRVLYASTDICQVSTADSVARIKPGNFLLTRNVTLTLRNGEHKTIPKKEIWGYSDAKGTIWRRFKTAYYQVLRIGDVVEYKIIEPRTVGPGMVIDEPVRKYSKTLDTKIVSSRRRALRVKANKVE
jgi:hypothetical protein